MQRLTVRFKILSMLVLMIVPIVVLALMYFQSLLADQRVALNEIKGLEAVEAISELVVHTQAHRGQTNILLSGNAGVNEARNATKNQLRQAMQAMTRWCSATPCWPWTRPGTGCSRPWRGWNKAASPPSSGPRCLPATPLRWTSCACWPTWPAKAPACCWTRWPRAIS
jgi:hypothetical protein